MKDRGQPVYCVNNEEPYLQHTSNLWNIVKKRYLKQCEEIEAFIFPSTDDVRENCSSIDRVPAILFHKVNPCTNRKGINSMNVSSTLQIYDVMKKSLKQKIAFGTVVDFAVHFSLTNRKWRFFKLRRFDCLICIKVLCRDAFFSSLECTHCYSRIVEIIVGRKVRKMADHVLIFCCPDYGRAHVPHRRWKLKGKWVVRVEECSFFYYYCIVEANCTFILFYILVSSEYNYVII